MPMSGGGSTGLRIVPKKTVFLVLPLLADNALTVGWGKTFWRVGRFVFLFLQKGPFLGKKSRKIVPKVQNLGPKKAHFFTLTMFWPRPEKVVQRKKYPFPK